MSAIRYRHPSRDIEIRVDDETLQGDEPIALWVGSAFVTLPISEARALHAGLGLAIVDAQEALDHEVAAGLRQPYATLAATTEQRATSAAAVAAHPRMEQRMEQWEHTSNAESDGDPWSNRAAVIDFEARRRIAAMAAIERDIAPAVGVAARHQNIVQELGRAVVIKDRPVDPGPSAVDLWSTFTDEQRLELRAMCCRGCGSLDTSCQCGNDE